MTETSSNNSLIVQDKDSQKKHSSGWISIYRSLPEHWIWDDAIKLKWWLTMLFEVNHADNKFVLGYEIFEIKRGQSSNSLRTRARLFNTTPKTVSKFFSLLKNDSMITIKILGKGKQSTTLMTISNYNEYQSESKRKVTHKVTHEVPTNNNVNNGNNVNYINKENESDFFYLKTERLEFPVSKYLQTELKTFLDVWQKKNPDIKIVDILKKMDVEKVGHKYNNEAHIQNTFNKIAMANTAGDAKPKSGYNRSNQADAKPAITFKLKSNNKATQPEPFIQK